MGAWRGLIFAAVLAALAGSAAAQPPPRQRVTPQQRQAAEAELARFNSARLTRFADDEQFRRYLGAVLAADRARSGWYYPAPANLTAEADTRRAPALNALTPICPDADPQCAVDADDDVIYLTGARVTHPINISTTNNQMRDVDEGDIVKQIGRFLLVLQDGRIFVIDTRGGDGRRLALADRIDVYTDPHRLLWYDEMLVFGDRILITGYSRQHDATELSVFRLDEAGRLSRAGVFHLSGDDYFNATNYASRMIGDNLVIYLPFEIEDMVRSSFEWPVVRRWTAGAARQTALPGGRSLFDAAQIYRPVRDTANPTVHTVSVCPLGSAGGDRPLECRTTAFIAANSAQWYVTASDAFLWTIARDHSFHPQSCTGSAADATDHTPALLYRVPVGGSAPGLVAARGVPPDQFALHASDGRLRALVKDRPPYCDDEPSPEAGLALLDVPLTSFADTVRDVEAERYTRLPGVKSHFIASRFTDRYLVYGSLGGSLRGRAETSMPPAFAVPLDRPRDARALPIRHTVIRAERVGDAIVVTGYRDRAGLQVTLIDLDRVPRISSSVQLGWRFESEGRSHAFNSFVGPDGHGIIGVPTIDEEALSSRAPWRSAASDLSYITVDPQGRLRHVGELARRFDYVSSDDDPDGIPGYQCEVSCIDWYGNSRPIFTDGRIFALAGTELIEGRFSGGEIAEVQRLNIALASTRGGEVAATSAAR